MIQMKYQALFTWQNTQTKKQYLLKDKCCKQNGREFCNKEGKLVIYRLRFKDFTQINIGFPCTSSLYDIYC